MQHPLGWFLVLLTSCAAYARGPLDKHPPELVVEAPDGPVRGIVALPFEAFDPQGVEVTVTVDDGERVAVDSALRIDTRRLTDGLHEVTVTATDGSFRGNDTVRRVQLEVDNTAPKLAVHVTPLAQGRTGAVFVGCDEPVTVETEVLGVERALHPVGEGRWRALVGVAASQVAGVGAVVIRAMDRAGNHASISRPVEVATTPFANGGFIDIRPDEDPDPAWIAELDRLRAERLAAACRSEVEQHWTGPLLRPVAGHRTSPYGKLRTYVGGLKKHHEGVDFASPVGTPVVASAAGEVALARDEPVYGKTVIVQHGHGLATSYNHLSSIEVAPGERVVAGQRLGGLGSTGFSTGPHLHWGLTIDGVEVDAEQWLATSFDLTPEIDGLLAAALYPARASRRGADAIATSAAAP